ncbi:hypothetical protein OGAPHI_006019 [Ogataea philodendri]|uniref:Uncharacterized protein n=1 Tax=Ogataea philodendri TaxID=1378263 RepID=A0A9P8NZ04_9ASCO|nr:uncharacterized protein OGAPHI_006019 [Ogataea philodendri]KAH3661841.1 hypothetical protein OGAPHI_006019 [Ogataea philodendri]
MECNHFVAAAAAHTVDKKVWYGLSAGHLTQNDLEKITNGDSASTSLNSLAGSNTAPVSFAGFLASTSFDPFALEKSFVSFKSLSSCATFCSLIARCSLLDPDFLDVSALILTLPVSPPGAMVGGLTFECSSACLTFDSSMTPDLSRTSSFTLPPA